MHRPQIEAKRVFSASDMASNLSHCSRDLGWNLPGEVHVKSKLANLPRDQVARLWNAQRKKALDSKTNRTCADQASRAPIGEQQIRQHLLQVLSLLKMQRAELETQDQHHGIRLRSNDMVCRL